MLDHIGFPVAHFERAKAFYTKALAPLGYALLKNVDLSDETGPGGYAGLGQQSSPVLDRDRRSPPRTSACGFRGEGSRLRPRFLRGRNCRWRSRQRLARIATALS